MIPSSPSHFFKKNNKYLVLEALNLWSLSSVFMEQKQHLPGNQKARVLATHWTHCCFFSGLLSFFLAKPEDCSKIPTHCLDEQSKSEGKKKVQLSKSHYTLSQVVQALRSTSEYMKPAAQKIVRTAGISIKATVVQQEETISKGGTPLSPAHRKSEASHHQMLNRQTCRTPICSRNVRFHILIL